MLRTVIRKGIKVLIFYTCLWLFTLFSFSFVKAEELLSSHNEEQAAKQAAMDKLFDTGCTRTSMRRTGKFQVIRKSEEQLDVIGSIITVDCMKWATAVSPPMTTALPKPNKMVYVFTWEAPATREDGEEIPPGGISGYNVYANSVLVADVTATQWEYTPSDHLPLPVRVAITAMDTHGQESSKTEEIVVSQ